MGKPTISMAIFNSYVKLPEGRSSHGKTTCGNNLGHPQENIPEFTQQLSTQQCWMVSSRFLTDNFPLVTDYIKHYKTVAGGQTSWPLLHRFLGFWLVMALVLLPHCWHLERGSGRTIISLQSPPGSIAIKKTLILHSIVWLQANCLFKAPSREPTAIAIGPWKHHFLLPGGPCSDKPTWCVGVTFQLPEQTRHGYYVCEHQSPSIYKSARRINPTVIDCDTKTQYQHMDYVCIYIYIHIKIS